VYHVPGPRLPFFNEKMLPHAVPKRDPSKGSYRI
jgi:hypothetical protein